MFVLIYDFFLLLLNTSFLMLNLHTKKWYLVAVSTVGVVFSIIALVHHLK
jgi:hypothetical protein